MEQFKLFSAKKSDVVASLRQLKDIIGKLDGVGLDVSEDIAKIEQSIRDIESDALRIALLGAFSDGKTSVVAGWLGQVVSDMKIDTDESSDQLAIYRPENLPGKCEIVDTPGLFGDKERTDGEGAVIQYGDITKKYLSEAHLIFYVADATNPLKDSHKEVVKWVLRDLNKLSSTIFVINKMDEVADLRDAEDFNNQARIKKENVLSKLQRFVGLTDSERLAVNIVCIASKPNNRGFDYWFEKKDMYEERSRINDLKNVTTSILDTTTRDLLVKKTGIDVIRDIVGKKIVAAENEYVELDLYASNMEVEIKRIEQDIAAGKAQLLSAKGDLQDELMDAEKRLLVAIRVLSKEDVLPFLEDEIGYSKDDIGYKLRMKIERSCERCFQQSVTIVQGLSDSITKQLDSSENFINAVSSSALKASGKAASAVSKIPVNTIKAGVFAARDAIGKVTGMIFKFKPWGATKIAANISKWAGPVGAAITVLTDVIEVSQRHQAEKELETLRKDLVDLVKDHFKNVYDILSDQTKILEFFAPQILVFEEVLVQQREALTGLQEKQVVLGLIKKEFRESYFEDDITDVEVTT